MLSVLLLSQTTLANDLRADPVPPGPCDEVIRAADQAIEKRNELINLQAGRIGELRDDNERLTNAVLTLKSENDNATRNQWLYGAGGVLLGIAAGALLNK